MPLINFDCPECGHNLEVDEGGAGFIVKCPECGNPLQIPQLPPSRRRRKLVMAFLTLAAIVLLLVVNLVLAARFRRLDRELADTRTAYEETVRQGQLVAMAQETRIRDLTEKIAAVKIPDTGALTEAALATLDEAEALSQQLDDTARRLLDSSPSERTALLRAHLEKVVEAAKNSLPAAPVETNLGPGRGIQGRQIVFPVLPGPEGQILRENAEITGVDEDKVSVKFPGGTATYLLSELHPGVAAYLPVDRLYVLPRRQWAGEVIRVHQLAAAAREQRIAALRDAIQSRIPDGATVPAP